MNTEHVNKLSRAISSNKSGVFLNHATGAKSRSTENEVSRRYS